MTVSKGMVFSYNAENRLVEASPKNPQQGSVKATYIYDYMGRRARKTLYTYSSGSWQKQKDISFIYDGWNMVKESEKSSDSSPEVPTYYVWGLDLSQSMQGAGGVGGLIASVKAGNEYLYSFDVNGNVGQMVKLSDGSIAARYEYDPFGKTVFAEGAMAAENPYRFSTKYQDDETGLYYYGFRYYDVDMGRWINRDPSVENGGINLHAVYSNNLINNIDILGLFSKQYHHEIIDNAYKNFIKEEYLEYLKTSDSGVDYYRQFNGEYHYDNNGIEDGDALIQKAFSDINKLEDEIAFQPDFYMTARVALDLDHFAAVTHASADFFAHSNAVEREVNSNIAAIDVLRSGVFSIPDHVMYMIGGDIAYWHVVQSYYYQIHKQEKRFTHSELNKDGPETPEGSIYAGGETLHGKAVKLSVEMLKKRLETFKEKAPCIWAYIKKK